MKKDELTNFIKSLNEHETKIANLLLTLNESDIDFNSSKIETWQYFRLVTIHSVNNQFCPFLFSFGFDKYKNNFSFIFNRGAEVICDINIESDDGLMYVLDFVPLLFKSQVHEELIYRRNKLVRLKYSYSYYIDSIKKEFTYNGINTMFWFLGKRLIVESNYKPWKLTD